MRDTFLIVLRPFQTVLALALVACSSAPPPEPAAPSGLTQESSAVEPDPGTPPEPPGAVADDGAELPEPPPPAHPEEPQVLAEADDGTTGGAACTATDSNGPEPGGTRTDTCPEGQLCVCDRAGGYSCAGTCRRSTEASVSTEAKPRCPCPSMHNRFGEFPGGYCGARACAADGQLLSCHDNGWVGLKAVCKGR